MRVLSGSYILSENRRAGSQELKKRVVDRLRKGQEEIRNSLPRSPSTEVALDPRSSAL